MTKNDASLLRSQMRHRREHFCLFPKYVVEDRQKIRKFHTSDIPNYIIHSLAKKLAHVVNK